MIRLTAQQAADFGEVFITDWYALRPIEIKDGTFILPKKIKTDLGKFKLKSKKKIKDEDLDNVIAVLDSLPVRNLKQDELIIYEL